MMKDLFSQDSDLYAKFRPTHPLSFFEELKTYLPDTEIAWDCATGNGQVASKLAEIFKKVEATDISSEQLKNAKSKKNIQYSTKSAEFTEFEDKSFDLITVSQAIHWFDFDKFYKEVYRTLKDDGVFAVLGIGSPIVNPDVDELFHEFHDEVLGPYWQPENQLVFDEYKTIPFPFDEFEIKPHNIREQWTLDQFLGLQNTWSATRNFKKQNGYHPLDSFVPRFESVWKKDELKTVEFPVFYRIGKKKSNFPS